MNRPDRDGHRGDVDGDPVGVQRGDQRPGRGVEHGRVDSPSASTTGASTNRPDGVGPEPDRHGRRTTITAMQVNAVMNSYMLPHGTRCSASPRVTMPRMCAASPSTVSASAARSQSPAGGPPARQRLADRHPPARRRRRQPPGSRPPGGPGPRPGARRRRHRRAWPAPCCRTATRAVVSRLAQRAPPPRWPLAASPEGEVAGVGQHGQRVEATPSPAARWSLSVGQPEVDGHEPHSLPVG